MMFIKFIYIYFELFIISYDLLLNSFHLYCFIPYIIFEYYSVLGYP